MPFLIPTIHFIEFSLNLTPQSISATKSKRQIKKCKNTQTMQEKFQEGFEYGCWQQWPIQILSCWRFNAMHTTQRNHIHIHLRVDATASRVQSAVTTKKVSKSMEVKAFLEIFKSKN